MADDERIRRLRLIQRQQAEAQRQQTQDRPAAERGVMRPFALFNEGVARAGDAFVGLPARGVNIGLEALGADARLSEQPVSDLMRMGRVGRAEPENIVEQGIVGAGEAGAMMLPFNLGINALAQGAGLGARVAGTMIDPVIRTPVTALSAELGAGAGARIAEELAERHAPDNALAGAVAPLVGGLAGGVAPYAALQGPGARLGRAAGRAVAREAFPFTERGARQIAGERLRQLSADPDRAVERLGQETISGLSPAQRTGEPGLMALERGIAARDPMLAEQMRGQSEAAARTLRENLSEMGGNPEVARSYFADEIDRARQAAASAVDAMEPRTSPGQVSIAVRRELEGAQEAARTMEREIWGRIPRTVQVDTNQTSRALADMIETTGRARQGDIPPVARQFFDAVEGGERQPWFEMHDLYSALRQYAREQAAGAAPNSTRIANANRLADAILRDIEGSAPSGTEIGNLTRAAINYSREMHEAFSQGTVGRILGSTRAGGDAVDPALTLETAIGAGGTRGAVGAQDIRRAGEFPGDHRIPEAIEDNVSDFLSGRFHAAATRDGQVRVPAAETFAQRNQELLGQFPQVRQQVETAIRAGRELEAVETSIGSVFAATQEGREFARSVFGPGVQNPAQAALALRRQAMADQSGEAMAGVKGAAMDFLIGRSTTTMQGDQVISGSAMRSMLREHDGVFRAVFSEAEINRIRRVASEFERVEQAARSGTLDRLIERRPNAMVSYLARVVAARSGAQMGAGTSGASLQAAGMASRRMQMIMERLTGDRAEALLRDAIQDPALMRALMEDFSTPAAQRRVAGRLTEWLRGYTATQTTDALGVE